MRNSNMNGSAGTKWLPHLPKIVIGLLLVGMIIFWPRTGAECHD